MSKLNKIQEKKLGKEIEQSKNLSRSERRKKERELNKKYSQKNIRVKSGKTFTKSEGLTREQWRELLKDKKPS